MLFTIAVTPAIAPVLREALPVWNDIEKNGLVHLQIQIDKEEDIQDLFAQLEANDLLS
jgi:hypothetical protein